MSIWISLLVISLVAIKEHAGQDIYTPPPKSEECLQRERTEKVIRMYNELANLTLKQLFVLTRDDANNFTNLVIRHEQIRKPPVRKCDRALPKYATCKIEEVGDILNETKCFIQNGTSRPLTPQPADFAKKYHKAYRQRDALKRNKMVNKQRHFKKDFMKRGKFSEKHRDRKIFSDQQHQRQQKEESPQEQHHQNSKSEINNFEDDGIDFDDWEQDQDAKQDLQRDKRSIYKAVSGSQKLSEKNDDGDDDDDDDDDDTNGNTVILKEGEKIRNKDGSITEVRVCLARASRTSNGNHRLTKECAVTTVLPANHFPRYLNEVLCDYQDSSCLSGEGAGYQRVIRITFKRDKNRTLGVGKLGDWEDYVQEIRTSCSCQLLPNSVFQFFI